MTVQINNATVRFHLGTGSDITIIDEQTRNRIGESNLKNTDNVSRGISGKKLIFWGKIPCNIALAAKTKNADVYVFQFEFIRGRMGKII